MPARARRHAVSVVDLAFGDCGKGTVVDFLTRAYGANTVVRFNGGPQAGHNVITPDGRQHTFAQFGSGTFVPGVRTLLSRFMLIEPYALLNEANHLAEVGVADALNRLTIDGRCVVITPPHQAANRLRELARGGEAHGTCGMGVGEAVHDATSGRGPILRAADLGDRDTVVAALRETRVAKLAATRSLVARAARDPRAEQCIEAMLDPRWIDVAVEVYSHIAGRVTIADEAGVRALLAAPGVTIFEGAQGVLLDESFGFHPHTTWSNTTFRNADAILDECGFDADRTRLGVVRTYFTRHGPGPFVTEDASLAPRLPEPHNNNAGWQGEVRVGAFDAVAARYALGVTGPVEGLAVTHLDRVSQLSGKACHAYDIGRDIEVRRPADPAYRARLTESLRRCRPLYTHVGDEPDAWVDFIERETGVNVLLRSWGATAKEKQCDTRLSRRVSSSPLS